MKLRAVASNPVLSNVAHAPHLPLSNRSHVNDLNDVHVRHSGALVIFHDTSGAPLIVLRLDPPQSIWRYTFPPKRELHALDAV